MLKDASGSIAVEEYCHRSGVSPSNPFAIITSAFFCERSGSKDGCASSSGIKELFSFIRSSLDGKMNELRAGGCMKTVAHACPFSNH